MTTPSSFRSASFRRSLGVEDALSRDGLHDALQAADNSSLRPEEARLALCVMRRALALACGLTLPDLMVHARARKQHLEGAGDDGANGEFDIRDYAMDDEGRQAADRG